MDRSKLDKFVRFSNGLIWGCPVPTEINHSESGLVRYLDVCCSSILFNNWSQSFKTEKIDPLSYYKISVTKAYQMFWDLRAANVDVVANSLNFFEACLQDVDLSRHFTLTLAAQHQKGWMQILKKMKVRPGFGPTYFQTSNLPFLLERSEKLASCCLAWLTDYNSRNLL
jgi:hypothetical protein